VSATASNSDPVPPRPEAALAGVRVLDLSLNLAGPFCAQILADLGAEVLKVERPGAGDPARAWAPPAWGGDGTLFLSANRGKRSLALELGTAEGTEILDRLLERTDVLIQSFLPAVSERLGLTEDRLRLRFPHLLLCTVTAYGHEGPDRERPGYDPLLQAYAGLLSVTGPRGGDPVRVGTSLIDIGTGMWAAIGVLAALRARDGGAGVSGESAPGTHVRVSLLDTALAWSAYHLMGTLATGQEPGPMGTGIGMIAPYGAFPASDGSLMIAAGNDGLFRKTCLALGTEEWLKDPRFQSNPLRVEHREELEALLTEVTRRFTRAELEERLQAAGVPCAPIRGMAEVAEDPSLREGAFRAEPHPRIPGYRAVALPPTWEGRRAPSRRPPPKVGEDTDAILEEAGYGREEIETFRARGIVG